MKKWRKRLSCTLALYCLAGALTGCGGGNSSAETAAGQSQTEAMGQSSAASAEEPTTVQETAAAAGETRRVTQQLSENLLIDADAVIPAKSQYSTYTLKMVDTDPDRLFAIFCPDGYETYTAVDRGYMVYQESSGK